MYEAEILPMKSELTTLATLRTRISSGPNVDEALRVKCTQLAIEHEKSLSRLKGIRPAVGFGPA